MKFNDVPAWLLRSPLHGVMSGSVMLVTVTGRKSGKAYTTPVNYVEDGGVLWTTSLRSRTWWRNLRPAPAPVTLRLRGADRRATGQAIEDAAAVTAAFERLFRLRPAYAGRFGVRSSGGGFDPGGMAKVAAERVMVKFVKVEST